jgi:dUTPase
VVHNVRFTLTQAAIDTFKKLKIDPRDYCPAYDGESAGLDLYNMGPEVQIHGRTNWSILEEKSVLVPVGIRVFLPKNFVGLIRERGCISRSGMTYRGGVIDPGYTGEIFINIINLGERETVIPTGSKLPLQLIVVPCLQNFQLVSEPEYNELTEYSKRATGCLGSSDRA